MWAAATRRFRATQGRGRELNEVLSELKQFYESLGADVRLRFSDSAGEDTFRRTLIAVFPDRKSRGEFAERVIAAAAGGQSPLAKLNGAVDPPGVNFSSTQTDGLYPQDGLPANGRVAIVGVFAVAPGRTEEASTAFAQSVSSVESAGGAVSLGRLQRAGAASGQYVRFAMFDDYPALEAFRDRQGARGPTLPLPKAIASGALITVSQALSRRIDT